MYLQGPKEFIRFTGVSRRHRHICTHATRIYPTSIAKKDHQRNYEEITDLNLYRKLQIRGINAYECAYVSKKKLNFGLAHSRFEVMMMGLMLGEL